MPVRLGLAISGKITEMVLSVTGCWRASTTLVKQRKLIDMPAARQLQQVNLQACPTRPSRSGLGADFAARVSLAGQLAVNGPGRASQQEEHDSQRERGRCDSIG